MYVMQTMPSFRIRAARATPAMIGMSSPSIEIGPITPRSTDAKWRLPSFPPDGEVARARYWAKSSRGA